MMANGFSSLSAEDQKWAKSIGRFGAWKKAVSAAVQENKAERVKYIFQNNKLSRAMHRDLTQLAATHKAAEALEVLLLKKDFDFTDSSDGDRQHAVKLFDIALTAKDMATWQVMVLRNASTSASGSLSDTWALKQAINHNWRDAISAELDRVSASDTDFFATAVEHHLQRSDEDLAFVLAWTQKFTKHGPVLDHALQECSKTGAEEKTRMLLDKGADPNTETGYALFQSLSRGHKDIFEMLVEAGGKLDVYGQDMLTRLRQEQPKSDLLPYLADKIGTVVAAVVAEETQKNLKERYHLVTPDSFSETLRLPEGRTLTTIFNFATQQQTVIAERAPANETAAPAMAVTVRDFSDIADMSVIERAHERLVALGGAAPEYARLVSKPVLGKTSP
jgi:hypothetical protein